MISVINEFDDTDIKILELLQKQPEISHAEIGKLLNKSTSAIGARNIKNYAGKGLQELILVSIFKRPIYRF